MRDINAIARDISSAVASYNRLVDEAISHGADVTITAFSDGHVRLIAVGPYLEPPDQTPGDPQPPIGPAPPDEGETLIGEQETIPLLKTRWFEVVLIRKAQ